ncbi:hypothetical protein BCR24_12220 [Enterococcus ureilyticus]|uniref:Uncharacterized protein n=1 Tax=Enterococcus ureilyticus TaxID=1131292 RepID=A0A1E5HEA7_9ENTE|nr:hypothetical protein [Enterococcus ureilyticus]MBM7689527.1 hypothetical protein [Enterococcus ureilyticus]MBO0446261.1 hypothetical protein [Enterococcus ureilyticus]OEG23282.1 hypothetical protein BCR24_12220 [Enterococcus ureilyticus]
MKKKLFISGGLVVLGLLLNALSPVTALAEDLLPSEVYYRDHIAVYEVNAKSPQLKQNEQLDPGGAAIGGGGYVGSGRASSGRTSSRKSSSYRSPSGRSSSRRTSASSR